MSDFLPQDAPVVSVIICTNRCDDYFHRALLSIEHQDFKDIEILVIANGLDDADYEKLLKSPMDPRTRVFRTHIFGLTFSLNLALHLCRAALVARMDADDISYPNRLAEQVKFLNENPDVSVCGSDYHIINEKGEVIDTCHTPTDNKSIRRLLVWKNPFCHPTVMFRRVDVLGVGGYAGQNSEDYELWVRLYEDENIHFANINIPLLGYRVPTVSLARRSRRAYVHVAGAQFRAFVHSKRPKWLVASLVSAAKAWFRATRP